MYRIYFILFWKVELEIRFVFMKMMLENGFMYSRINVFLVECYVIIFSYVVLN